MSLKWGIYRQFPVAVVLRLLFVLVLVFVLLLISTVPPQGIGVDDMFLLMSSWSETLEDTALSVPERVGTTLVFAAMGMTVTSVTDLLAFLVGSTSVFFSVEIFCLYTGMLSACLVIVPSCLVLHLTIYAFIDCLRMIVTFLCPLLNHCMS